MLKQHRVQQLEQRLKMGDAWENRDLVFSDLRGGYFNSNYLLRMFKKLLQEAGVPHMPIHDLRHSAATILLGHSDISITLGLYSHLLPNMQQDVVNKWEDAFKGENKEDDKELQ